MRCARLVAVAFLLVTLPLSGCAAGGDATDNQGLPSAPEAVVRRFHEAVSEGDVQLARDLMVPSSAAALEGDIYPFFRDITDLRISLIATDTAVSAGGDPTLAAYHGLAEYGVDFINPNEGGFGEPAGEQTRFAVVGQEKRGDAWRVISAFHTGP